MMKQSPLDRIREQAELSGCNKGKEIYPPLDFEAAHHVHLDKVIMDIARLPCETCPPDLPPCPEGFDKAT